jgi:3-oxoacyl-[acyl-carrier-protein] synthase II
MTTKTEVAALAITGYGVVSPAGLGSVALGQAIKDGKAASAEPLAGIGDYPPLTLWGVPDLPYEELLGRKGLRNVDRLTQLALIACKLALEEADGIDEAERPTVGVVMATSTGSLRSLADVGLDTVLQEKPYMVNPARFPNVVMNSCAGQIAIRNDLRGVNATISGGQVSSLAAVRYARATIGQGRATRLLTGGVEELSPIGAWGWHLSRALADGAAVGEGSAMFLLEDGAVARAEGRAVLADILACEVGYAGTTHGELGEGLVRCATRALERSGVTAADLDVAALGAAGQVGLDDIEDEAVTRVAGDVHRLRIDSVVGQCYSASAALQLGSLLAHWDGETGRTGLVTSIGDDGNVGALIVRS